ncbi:MAG: GTPase domain-containing protein [Candidatus Thorarchaeota archaeon]
MIVDYSSRSVAIKLVFFGPAMSGKTTSIKWLFSTFGSQDKLMSIDNSMGRTMLCDFGTLEIPLGNTWSMNVNIWTATGQEFYSSTREVVLVGTDGVVFVADSQSELLEDNLSSWNELMALLSEARDWVPIVVCLNKADLPSSVSEFTLRNHLGIPERVPVLRTVAKDGTNVVEAVDLLLQRALQEAVAPRCQ